MRSRILTVLVLVAMGVADVRSATDSLYLAPELFRYADNQRYTMSGGTPRLESDLQPVPTIAVGVGFTSLMVGLHIYQRNAWWPDDADPEFRVIDDSEYARGLDKLGHMYSTYIMSTLSADLMMACGLNHETSTWIGGAMGFGYTMYVEIEDGYAKDWGFSPTDAIANFVGASFYVAQNKVPFLQNFTPRWSYIPASWTGDATSNNRQKIVIDDYNSTTFWLACNVNNLLPEGARPYWPDWLMFSAGYGVRNYDVVDANGEPVGVTRRFLFGLDYDWVKILPPSDIGFVNYLRQALNYIRLPGPTLEVGDDGVKFGIFYPFAIVVPL
jgi:hypothetical protein